jgi:LysM repeat protein
MRVRLLTALALAVLLPAFPGAAREGEEPPQIFLERKVYSHTSGGRRSFYETYTVEKGDTLWKILERKAPLTPARYSEQLHEFRRVNPSVKDPSRLVAGQKLLIPSAAEGTADSGKTVTYAVKKGDTLTGILASRGVPTGERPKYLAAVREVNPSVRDVNRIYAGRTIHIPTEGYFGEAEKAREEPVAPPALAAAVPPPAEGKPVAEVPPAAPLTRDVATSAGEEGVAGGKPVAELLQPASPAPDAPVVETGRKGVETDVVTPPGRSPYRGLLSDLFNALGEKWVERGTMFLPIPSGGEVVIRLEDFPVVRFSGGAEALLDFRGGLPQRVREAITGTWPHVRVVSLSGAADAGDMIDRILAASGYHSFKEGLSRPVVIGETVSVSIPARWVVQRTDQSLLSGDLALVKEVPERPGEELLAVLRYARRVGIRVLPYAADPSTMEGFLVGLELEEEGAVAPPVTLAVPAAGGLPAVDFGLSFLGIPVREGERLRIGGKGEGFRLVVQPERIFEAGGRKYVVDTGRMAPPIRAIMEESGYTVFPAGKDEPGRAVFQRLLSAAGLAAAERKGYPLGGGGNAGYAIHVTGAFLSLPAEGGGKARTAVLVRGKVHTATRALLRDLGVEIVEW